MSSIKSALASTATPNYIQYIIIEYMYSLQEGRAEAGPLQLIVHMATNNHFSMQRRTMHSHMHTHSCQGTWPSLSGSSFRGMHVTNHACAAMVYC